MKKAWQLLPSSLRPAHLRSCSPDCSAAAHQTDGRWKEEERGDKKRWGWNAKKRKSYGGRLGQHRGGGKVRARINKWILVSMCFCARCQQSSFHNNMQLHTERYSRAPPECLMCSRAPFSVENVPCSPYTTIKRPRASFNLSFIFTCSKYVLRVHRRSLAVLPGPERGNADTHCEYSCPFSARGPQASPPVPKRSLKQWWTPTVARPLLPPSVLQPWQLFNWERGGVRATMQLTWLNLLGGGSSSVKKCAAGPLLSPTQNCRTVPSVCHGRVQTCTRAFDHDNIYNNIY